MPKILHHPMEMQHEVKGLRGKWIPQQSICTILFFMIDLGRQPFLHTPRLNARRAELCPTVKAEALAGIQHLPHGPATCTVGDWLVGALRSL